jgi:hypothetical protein
MIAFEVSASLPDTKVFHFERAEAISQPGEPPAKLEQLTELDHDEPAGAVDDNEPIELKLFNNAADVKMQFGEVLRHLSIVWRPEVFSQIDQLLNPAEWNEESSLIERASFRTFLRFLDYGRPTRVPSLGVSHDGYLMAAWVIEGVKLFVTFLPDDRVDASFLSKTERNEDQITAWRGPVVALKDRVILEGCGSCLFETGSNGEQPGV